MRARVHIEDPASRIPGVQREAVSQLVEAPVLGGWRSPARLLAEAGYWALPSSRRLVPQAKAVSQQKQRGSHLGYPWPGTARPPPWLPRGPPRMHL